MSLKYPTPLLAASDLADLATPNLARVNVNKGTANVTDGANTVIDFSTGNVLLWTLAASRTTAAGGPTNMAAGATYMLIIKQGGTGSYTITWDAAIIWAGGSAPTLQTAVGAVDIISLVYDGTTVRAAAGAGWAS